jgi:serine/threonine protein kinase
MQAAEELPLADDERVQRALGRIGQVVRGRWHLDALLGVGGTAAVYAATHRNGKRVALKVLHPELSGSSEMRQRFIDEGYVANSIGHPGAVSVIDDDVTEEGDVFLIMDLLEGETLDQIIARAGSLPAMRVLTIAAAVLDILAAAHGQGIVHRDVKPDNIFITQKHEVKLLDFGIAQMTAPRRGHNTGTGGPLGTPAFMPPEQARGQWDDIDGRTDLWAVGATMFYLLTGRDVHQGDTVNEELLSAMTKKAPSLAKFAPHLPQPLVDLVDRALAFEREDRWPTAREMQTTVRKVQGLVASESMASPSKESGPSSATPTLVTPSFELRRRKLPRPPPRASAPSLRSRVTWPAVVIAVSASISFAGLFALRQARQTFQPHAASAPLPVVMAVHETSPDLSTPSSDEWLALAPRSTPETAASPETITPSETAATGGISRANESSTSPAKTNSERVRPKAASRSLEDPRVFAPADVPSLPALSSPERMRVIRAPVDPLDRRK